MMHPKDQSMNDNNNILWSDDKNRGSVGSIYFLIYL